MAEASPYGMSFDERLALLAMKPVIDVQVCGHCNLRCAGCMHFAPLAEATFLDLDEYENDLTRFSSIDDVSSYFDAIVLMGGEPLLHPQIVEIIRMTRRHLPKILLALCTNGLLLKRMGEEAEALGADAVIRLRYGSSQVMDTAAEVLAYGTAVKVLGKK